MLTMESSKYKFIGIRDGYYLFKRRDKREWIVVEEARLIDSDTRFVRYFNVIKDKKPSKDNCEWVL